MPTTQEGDFWSSNIFRPHQRGDVRDAVQTGPHNDTIYDRHSVYHVDDDARLCDMMGVNVVVSIESDQIPFVWRRLRRYARDAH